VEGAEDWEATGELLALVGAEEVAEGVGALEVGAEGDSLTVALGVRDGADDVVALGERVGDGAAVVGAAVVGWEVAECLW